MEKKQLENAMKKSFDKLLSNVKNPEVKLKTDKILNDAEKKFTELDKPVVLTTDKKE
jgi:hypothetical protein